MGQLKMNKTAILFFISVLHVWLACEKHLVLHQLHMHLQTKQEADMNNRDPTPNPIFDIFLWLPQKQYTICSFGAGTTSSPEGALRG